MGSLGLLSLALLAPLLAACGGGEGEPGATFTSSPNQSASPTEKAEVASDDCKVAAVTWADRATDHVLTMTTTAPAFGEPEDLADLDDLISQISVICPPAVVGGLGLCGLAIAGVIVGVGSELGAPLLSVVGYVVAGFAALAIQVAIIAAGVRLGVYHGTFDVDEERNN